MAKHPFKLFIVGVNKKALQNTVRLKNPPALYLYATRYLLERVSWFVAENGGRVECY